MNKVPLQLRLLLNIIVFSLPIIVLTVLMFRSETVNIEFGQKEELGIRLQQPYEQLFSKVAIAKLTRKDVDFSQDLDELKKVYTEIGPDLLFSSEQLTARKREVASLDYLTEQIDQKKWSEAQNSIKTAIAHLGDTSNLILDPDLDSYYLMDIVLLALPQAQDRIQTILENSTQFFQENTDEKVRIQAALYAALLKESDLNRIIADGQTAINEDKNFYGISEGLQKNLPATIQNLSKDIEPLIGLLENIAQGKKVEKTAFYSIGFKALDQSFDAWKIFNSELNHLIDMRLEALKHSRITSLLYSGLALLVTILFSIYIGNTINQSIKSILQSVLRLKQTATASTTISESLHNSSKIVHENMIKQAASVEETAASIEEINSMLKISTESSKQASSMAKDANEYATTGQVEIMSVLNSMRDISASSKRIVETISIIDDIAFQTNLLALNASVEAARAGEQGRGFAVVADAVRSLAQKSATAAKEINKLLQDNVELVLTSQNRADQAAQLLKDIVSSVQKVAALNGEIAVATQEQATGLSQISRAMGDFEQDSTANQLSMNEVSGASEAVLKQAQILQEIIIALESDVRGNRASQSRPFATENAPTI